MVKEKRYEKIGINKNKTQSYVLNMKNYISI